MSRRDLVDLTELQVERYFDCSGCVERHLCLTFLAIQLAIFHPITGSETVHKRADATTAMGPIARANHNLCMNASSVHQRNDEVQGLWLALSSSRLPALQQDAGIHTL